MAHPTPSTATEQVQATLAFRPFDDRLATLLRRHVRVLAWWCLANAVVALPMLHLTRGWLWYFALMNLSWAAANAFAALLLHRHTVQQGFRREDIAWRRTVQRHVVHLLLFNIALDVGYCAVGHWLYGLVPAAAYPDLWLGFGRSVLLQGVYLALHDTAFLWAHLSNAQQHRHLWANARPRHLFQRRSTKRVGLRNGA